MDVSLTPALESFIREKVEAMLLRGSVAGGIVLEP